MPQFNFNFPFAASKAGYPAILDTALVWLDNSTIQDTAGTVTNWANRGTGGASYDMDTVTSTPTVTTVNGLSSVLFDGGNDHILTGSAVLIAQPFTVHLVARAVTTPTVANEHFYSSDPVPGTDLHFIGMNNAQQNYQFHAGGNLLTTSPSVDTNIHLFSCEANNLSSSFYVSGIQAKTAGALGTNDWDYQVLGSARGLTVNDHCNCVISEQIVMPGIQTAAEYTDIQNYLIAKWGI